MSFGVSKEFFVEMKVEGNLSSKLSYYIEFNN